MTDIGFLSVLENSKPHLRIAVPILPSIFTRRLFSARKTSGGTIRLLTGFDYNRADEGIGTIYTRAVAEIVYVCGPSKSTVPLSPQGTSICASEVANISSHQFIKQTKHKSVSYVARPYEVCCCSFHAACLRYMSRRKVCFNASKISI